MSLRMSVITLMIPSWNTQPLRFRRAHGENGVDWGENVQLSSGETTHDQNVPRMSAIVMCVFSCPSSGESNEMSMSCVTELVLCILRWMGE